MFLSHSSTGLGYVASDNPGFLDRVKKNASFHSALMDVAFGTDHKDDMMKEALIVTPHLAMRGTSLFSGTWKQSKPQQPGKPGVMEPEREWL